MIQKAHWGLHEAEGKRADLHYPFEGDGGGHSTGDANIHGSGGSFTSGGEYSEDGGGTVFGDCHRQGWSYARNPE